MQIKFKQLFKSLKGLLILTVFLTSLIPTILIYAFDMYLLYYDTIKIAQEEIRLQENRFHFFYSNFLNLAKQIALTQKEILSEKKEENFYTSLKTIQNLMQNVGFRSFFIIDKNRKVVVSPEIKGITLKESYLLDIDIQEIRDIYITDFLYTKEHNDYRAMIILPLEQKELWLAIEVDLKAFKDIFAKDIINSYLLDRNNRVMFLKNNQILVDTSFKHSIVQTGKDNFCDFSINPEGVKVYACITSFPEHSYKLVTEITTDYMFRFFKMQIVKTTIVFILFGIIIIYILFKFSNKISYPIQEITSSIDEMEQERGFNLKIKTKTGILETEILVERFNLLLERIQNLIQDIQNISENIDKLFIVVKNFSQNIEKTSIDFSSILEENSASLEEINSNMEDIESIGKKNEESAKEIQELIETNLKRLNELSKNLENLAEISKSTSNYTKESKQQSESLKNMIYAMQETSERITEILSIIKEISDRTNLLSLNASIEAARAGESGKGFAVVAQSISNLAETTEKSVQDIEDLIEHTTNQMTQAIQYIDKSTEMMNKSFTMVNSLDEEIQKSKEIIKNQLERSDKILSNATKMHSVAKDTFNSIKFIKDVIREINQSIDEASKISVSFTETTKKLNDAVSDLDASAKKLRKQMRRFVR